jgi:peptidoglycan/LPS O-acetylase OafA/YrhL
VPDTDPDERVTGPVEVMLVAIAVVGVVAAAVILTVLLPDDLESIVYRTPLAIGVLIGGTALVLWRVARRGSRRV